LFTNPDPKGFFDAIAFWNRGHGIVLGDPVDGHFAIFTTEDGGDTWQRQQGPEAAKDEGAFAASGTALTVYGHQLAWFGTGGTGGARVFRSTDGGRTWIVATTAMRHDSASAGIFSLAFEDELHGEAVGGDYAHPEDSIRTSARTDDGGKTWDSPPGSPAAGYRSAVTFIPGRTGTLIAVGAKGCDVSIRNGYYWNRFSSEGFNALSAAPDGSVWAAGAKGKISKLTIGEAEK